MNSRVSLVAAALSILGIATQAAGCVFYLAPVLILHGPQYLSAFNASQLQAMSMLSLTMYGRSFLIALVLPKTTGVLMLIAGVGYLFNSFLAFVAPALWSRSPDFVYVTGLGELALTVWLLIMAVDERRWNEHALLAR